MKLNDITIDSVTFGRGPGSVFCTVLGHVGPTRFELVDRGHTVPQVEAYEYAEARAWAPKFLGYLSADAGRRFRDMTRNA